MLKWNFRFSARCGRDIRSSELLLGVCWFVTRTVYRNHCEGPRFSRRKPV